MSHSFRLRPLSAALCAALAFALAACGQSQPERGFASDPNAAVTGQFVAGQTLSAPISARDLKAETASFSVLAMPAEAVRNGRVTEKQFINGWRQSVSLDKTREAGDWNDLSIDIQTAPRGGGRGEIVLSKPTQEGVRREILARFNGTPMRIVNRSMHNALGPYGLAVGAGPGDMRCAFAWQWVDNLQAAARGEKGVSFFNNGEMAASIRMRLCRRGVTADELAQWYDQLRVSQDNLARVADAMRQNTEGRSAAAVASGPLGPVVTGQSSGGQLASADLLESTLVGGGTDASASRRATSRRPAVRQAAHRIAPTAREDQAPDSLVPATPADGRRYLGPVSETGGSGSQYAASVPATPGGATFEGLPARAYRGPTAPRAIAPR
ncbi:cellulose biosynthesis protein BcsN [Methylocystis sp. MJC1]|jgi:hypothetical protein|uniref:cellulose biosynthesis protein BcsN n=1 Tax=Methylocystis sp. MJC1 TaxID=2654282 RepID=UPI0013EC7437|nr:cellulose biosynthesis protein BcsN [Methylocystis sp. MJC1]KAF2989677.1 hypothetical protein MJC1_03229 [Methylocystis sp. MJC1]MBU6525615.1 cellulose biosynthesis protein BcsN [Methylocystis sp. MJC1]UZX12090.1 cellulose biosynthesis protein BcsN [Methylocystis sp. MJC1]